MKSIKSKLLLTLIPVMIVALVAVSWVNHNKAKEFLVKDFEEKAFLQLELIKSTIADDLTIHMERIKNIAKDANLQGDSRFIKQSILRERNTEYPEYSTFFIANNNGEAFTVDGKSLNVKDSLYFQKIMKENQEIAVSDPIVTKLSDEQVIVIAAPIKMFNRPMGIVAATLPLTELTKMTEDIKVSETGYTTILQADGMFITHPNEELAMKKKLHELDVPELVQAQNDLEAGKAGTQNYVFEGEERYVYYDKIPIIGWSALSVVPVKEATSQLSYLATLSFVTAAIVIAFCILIIFIFSSRLVRPIQKLSSLTTNLAEGDLTIKVENHTNDEVGLLGQNFNTMVEKIQGMLSKVQEVANHVKQSSDTLCVSSEDTKNSAEQVAVTISELATGTNDIANSVTSTTNQITTMLNTVDQIASFTDEVIETSEESRNAAKKGHTFSAEALQKMDEMNHTVLETSEIIGKLDKQSKQIGNIVEMITNIAGQTNLLALNASIEAARAGEHGKGFAVVAEEVRKLAVETTSSADQISMLINKTQEESHRAVKAAERGTKVVEEGTQTVIQTTEVFDEISTHVDEVLGRNKEIHEAIQLLKDTGSVIGKEMETISSFTEEASAGAQEVSATSEEQASSANVISHDAVKLAALAEELQEMMSQFRVK
ncbi:hypothetical protein BFG57_09170 [Bacillus solimangrovi]|uniref:Chemotaxis protein n=2 Tax=Bacillus solimangrovi TaxID=1305675 RepID=A0A1E5LJD9_9BACI|nr:methyl-accepting chemotaxis protein [Bacillus solimangrovi]OEH94212.1 hypothetical protein BFG57_09170 [Bacillus solimangrovi]